MSTTNTEDAMRWGRPPETAVEAVARAMLEAWTDAYNEGVSEPSECIEYLMPAAIKVIREKIEALGVEWTHVRAGVTTTESASAADFKREVLDLLK